MPLGKLAFGGFQGFTEVFIGQLDELLVVALQNPTGGRLKLGAQLIFGGIEDLLRIRHLLQLPLQAGYLGAVVGCQRRRFPTSPGTACKPAGRPAHHQPDD